MNTFRNLHLMLENNVAFTNDDLISGNLINTDDINYGTNLGVLTITDDINEVPTIFCNSR